MVMIFARGARQWYSLQPRGNVGVWICGACGRLEASFHLVAQVMGAIIAAPAAGFLPVMVLSPAASTVTPAQVTRQGLL
jgi:hypothetical protein